MQNKIVAISDAHLGQSGVDKLGQFSLLSTRVEDNLVLKFAGAVTRFAAGDKVSLVVVGDFLDLSLSYMEDALTDLRALLERVNVDEIVYVIGNHDIELWSLHCEEKNLLGSLRLGKVPSADPSKPGGKGLYKITPTAGEPFTLLQPLVDQVYGFGDVPITIAYPSYSVQAPDGTLIYFTHGNLFGGLYTTVSDILENKLGVFPHERIAATVNQPLIGLIYWLLGEMGEGMGVDGLIEHIYTDIQNGDGHDTEELIKRAADKLLAHGLFPGIPDRFERWVVVKLAMHLLRKRLPSSQVGASSDRHGEIEQTEADLLEWVKHVPQLKNRLDDTTHLTHVVTGHTHVPYQHLYPETTITGWNLGSWLVEPNHDLPRTGFLGIQRDGEVAWVDVK
jgi:UDP-2,3-diacylglucosamine pyrophosphatase LpxH